MVLFCFALLLSRRWDGDATYFNQSQGIIMLSQAKLLFSIACHNRQNSSLCAILQEDVHWFLQDDITSVFKVWVLCSHNQSDFLKIRSNQFLKKWAHFLDWMKNIHLSQACRYLKPPSFYRKKPLNPQTFGPETGPSYSPQSRLYLA